MTLMKTSSILLTTTLLLFVALTTASYVDPDESFHVNDDDDAILARIPTLPVPEYTRAQGNPALFPRIVGGREAVLGEFAGKVSLQNRQGYHFCGGTIIDERHIVTAAHCFVDDKTGRVTDPRNVQAMGNDLLITAIGSASRQVRFASHIFVHTQFNLVTLINDVAVVRVEPPFTLNYTTFRPMTMSNSPPADYVVCSVAGWGAVRENGTATARLMRIDAAVIPRSVCNQRESYGGAVRSGMFCAGSMLGGTDSCQGDSGGGILCNGLLAGVVSFGHGCARPRFPGVYADISHQSSFIASARVWNRTNSAIPVPTTLKPGGGTAAAIYIPLTLVTWMAILVATTSLW